MNLSRQLALVTLLTATNISYAQQVSCAYSYGIQTTVNGIVGQTYCSSNSEHFIDYLENLSSTNLAYTPTSAASIVGRFNDVNIFMEYLSNSTTLTVSMPEIGISNKTFTGATRDETEDNFVDWLKKEGIIGDIMNYQAQHSGTSPITGSGGLIPTIADTEYTTNMDNNSNLSNTTSIETGTDGIIDLGVSYGSFSVDGSADKVESFTLPLSYTYRFENKPNHNLIFSLPISMYKVGDAKGYHVGLGVAYRFPITEHWSLTPGVRYSLTASVDRANIASIASVSLMSVYQIPFDNFDVNIGNMIGYYKTGKFKAGDYSFNPNIQQTMLRNGVMISQPITLYGNKMAIEYSLIDTRYIGSEKPFIDNTQELGVTLGFHRDAKPGRLSDLRIGASYVNGAKGSDGFKVNFGYWF